MVDPVDVAGRTTRTTSSGVPSSGAGSANPSGISAPADLPATLGELRASGWTSVPVKHEIRRNAAERIRDGIPLFAQPGALPKDVLEDVIAQARALDMDAIREQIAQEAQQAPGTGQESPSDTAGQAQRGNTAGVDYPDANGAIV